ncbi:SRPBCC family protein [Nocardioides sp. 1609]|uniref:SRPBCC family protein n=1 Tax=Nocardioides sp. 1609 TaxID=2508327 RepID=UPI001ADA1AD0|nr:SRPBCC family protein [Nocardioides sp. 1609]
MPVVERTITVDRPLPAVWAFLSDFTTTEEWDPPTLSTERVSGDGGVGTTYHNVSKFDGRSTEVDYVVTEYVEHERLQLRGRAAGLALLDTITVEDVPGGTRVTYQAVFSPRHASSSVVLDRDGLIVLGDFVAESLLDSLEHL